MAGAGNFTSVTLGPDDNGVERLTVNGVTMDDDRNPVPADDVEAVYVAVEQAAARTTPLGATPLGEPQELRSVAVPAPEGAGGWSVMLDQGTPAYTVGERLFLVGLIVFKNDDPTFWHEMVEIGPG
jgi:hypothetical protein